MHKVSGELIGKITPDGFVPKKPKTDKKSLENTEVVELGASGYLYEKNSDILERLKAYFPDCWMELMAISILRITEGPHFKHLEDAYETSCLSTLLPGLNMGENHLTSLLHSVGKRTDSIRKFMADDADALSSCLLFGGQRVINESDSLENAHKEYYSKRRLKNQVNLVYAFSVSGDTCSPCYYKQFSGDIPNVTAISETIKEAHLDKKNITILTDMEFGSKGEFELIKAIGLKYIIPIDRTADDSKDNIPSSLSGYEDCFTYHGRSITHKSVNIDGYIVHLYLDASLLADEMNDFTARFVKKNNTIQLIKEREEKLHSVGKRQMSDEEFSALEPEQFGESYEERIGMGTLALRTNDIDSNGIQIYCLYKQRQAIEGFYKTYDDSLDFSSSYKRDNYSEEAWLFLNHLSAMMAYSVMDEIYYIDKSCSISLSDFISTMSKIFANKISGKWYQSKINKKRTSFAEMFDFNPEALIDKMNVNIASDI